MKRIFSFLSIALCLIVLTSATRPPKKGWISLFDGKTLNGWKVGTNASTFSIDSGRIKVFGPTAHLFYDGEVNNHQFKNFEFKAEVMTMPGSNSGIYFHTEYQEGGWPAKGYEVQVNNSHGDDIRTGSLYDIVDTHEVYAKDNEWYTEYIKVEGKRVIVKINDIVVVDYTEPEHPVRTAGHPLRLIGKGTFALQGHDPKSIVFYKNIMVKPLAD
ncbi:3-keto-disaccharide hydrolase [Flavihumibacter profundi]|uniref:3-keto-disaccharide hydrolase n=1 Tax=Flavihumibacter profundi TaxID=2716883 RepID=UPI001CC779D5|nr:DUF1080 domain-containing protein [Flavihumibacter profundi]MBZ5856985.1 DUF1080 domain-containing protein [Flavihumibacter profundi]